MRDGDAIGLHRCERLAKETLPRVAARDFDRHLMRLGVAGHIGIADHRGHAEPIGERAAERRIRVRIGAANVVIEMREPGEDDLVARGEIAQQECERDRIGSAETRRRPRASPASRANAWPA